MTGLIKFASQVELSEQLQRDPFTYLFLTHLPPNLPLSGKTRYLKEFVLALINLEQHASDTSTRNHWLSTAGGFSAAITIAGSTALAPFGGMILSGSALVAATATIIETLVTKSQTEAITKTLKLHRLALESQQSQQWAALWEYAQSDLFLAALAYASDGFVVGEKLIQRGDDSPFMRAVDFVAQCKGLEYIQVIEDARNLLSKPTDETKKLVMMPQQQATPTAIESPKLQNQSPIPKTEDVPDSPGLNILDSIVTTRRSTLFIGDTGSGKSVTQSYILTKFFERYPNAEVWAVSQKADSFCGLDKKGRVTLFDLNNPSAALAVVDQVWAIYNTRRKLPESKRESLPPVRLILADWLSINQSLEESKSDEAVKESKYLSRLADIIYNGRELNVCLLIDLQSYNLAAVGLKADKNSRKNFNIVGLGNYSVDSQGQTNESYGVLRNLVADRYIISEESTRSQLVTEFRKLQPVSQVNKRPIIFTTLSPARLALLPDLRAYKTVDTERSSVPLNAPEPDEVERLNVLMNKTFSDSEPNDAPHPEPLNLDPFNSEITPIERGSVVSFRRSGRSKEETIFLVWGAKKGGNKSYIAAKEKLDLILSESGLD